MAILRAASSPATTSAANWAAVLASGAVADFAGSLGPSSASSALARAGMTVDLSRSPYSSLIPSLVATGTDVSFVKEGDAIPVVDLTVTGPTLTPFKVATITCFTREMTHLTSIEAIVKSVLSEAVTLGLDAAILGSQAASDSQPAGVLNAPTAVAADPGTGEAAMLVDIGALAAAVSGVGGASLIFVAAPGEYAKLRLYRQVFPFPLFPSAALAAGSVVAIAANAFVIGVDPAPEIMATIEGLLHMDNATPLPIRDGGPIASPTRELFQTDVVALRFILRCSWGLRASAASCVAAVTDVTW